MTDRIVLSTDIGPSAGPSDLNDILSANGIGSLSFFSNSMDTKTSGIDLVAGYRNIALGSGTLAVNLAGNYQLVNERDGAVNNPQVIDDAGQSVLNATIEALTFTSRPKYKAILGFEYSLNKFLFTLNGTTFGPTEFRNAGMDEGLKVEFKTKMVTDLGIIYQLSPKTTLALNVNNLFNVLPEWEFKALDASGEAILEDDLATQAQSNLITFNQRYSMVTYDGSHFSQLGTIVNFALNVRL
jgi:iron complex outermembrane receptor protein